MQQLSASPYSKVRDAVRRRRRATKIHRVYRVFQDYFRPKRMRGFAQEFRIHPDMKVIDIGGSALNWTYIEEHPKITIVNISDVGVEKDPRFEFRIVDGKHLPYANSTFDVSYSNSVIEHVGNWENQKRFADELQRVSRYYYVQTPYRWFPVEPHFLAPFIHFLPRRMYRRLIPFFSLWYWITRADRAETDSLFEEIRLLDKRQMRELFPDAEILEERFLLFTKSLIAVKGPSSDRAERG